MLKYIFFISVIFTACTKETYVEGIDVAVDNNQQQPQQTDEPQDMGLYSFQSRWTGVYLALQNNQMTTGTSTYTWTMLKLKQGTGYYLKDPVTKLYLAANGSGVCSLISQLDGFAKWELQQVGTEDFSYIKNSATGGYINFETGTVVCGTIQSGWYSAQWALKH